MKQSEFVNATQAELDVLLVLAKTAFPQPQYELLAHVLGTFAYVMGQLQNAKTSLKRFRYMLFGTRTESMANVKKAIEGGIESTRDDPATQPADAGMEPPKRKGHGRNGA